MLCTFYLQLKMIVTFLQSFILETSELPTKSHTFDNVLRMFGNLRTLSSRDVVLYFMWGLYNVIYLLLKCFRMTRDTLYEHTDDKVVYGLSI